MNNCEKINVLIISGLLTREHSYRKLNDYLYQMLEATGRFNVKVTEEFTGATDETLEKYQLVLINYDAKEWINDPCFTYWGDSAMDALDRFVHRGGGIAFYHSSISVGEGTPDALKQMMGGCLILEEGGRRSPKSDFVVDVAAPEHPITKGLHPHFMVTGDDFLCGISFMENTSVEVLATVYDDLKDYPQEGFPPPHMKMVYIPDGDLSKMRGVNTDAPIAWTNRYGQGRVFVVSIGHDIDTMRRVDFLTLFVRGCEWAATGNVTLDPPDRTGENRLKGWPYY